MKSLGWFFLVVAVECAGIVACSKIPGFEDKAAPAVFNNIPVDSFYAREFHLKDGTHCVAYQTSITCDWENK